MPRAEAGISGGLPLFELCSSFWPPQRPAYKNKNSRIFWCFIFSLQPYFQGFVHSCKIYLSRALCTFDAHLCSVLIGQNWQPCRIQTPETWLQALLPLHSAARMLRESLLAGYRMEHSQVFFICFMIKNSLNKFPTHNFIISSTTNFIFKVNESVINMFYTLINDT